MTTFEHKTTSRRCPMPCVVDKPFTGTCPLLEAACEGARMIKETSWRTLAKAETEPVIDAQALLAAVSYCYARHTFGAVTMLNLWARDANLRELCHNEVPDVGVVRRFCHDNSVPIERCLTATLRVVAEQRLAEGYLTRVNEAKLAEEARRRMIMAAFVDSMELAAEREPAQAEPPGPNGSMKPVDPDAETVFCYAN